MTHDQEQNLHPLRPGYYHWDGVLAVRTEHAGRPNFFDGSRWHPVEDLGKFAHEATRITEQLFHELMDDELKHKKQ